MKIIHMVLFVMLALGQGFAAEADKKAEAAEKLVDVFKMEKMYTKILDQIENSEIAMMKAMNEEDGASEEIIKFYTDSTKKTMKVMKKTFPWEKMKSMLVSAHSNIYTLEEMIALTNFYKSPIGQRCIDKQPQLSASIMKNTQAFMMKIMPEIKKELKLAKDKIKKEYQKKDGA